MLAMVLLGDLAAVQFICRVMLVTMLPSHAGDDATGATWSRLDIYIESYWRQCCQVMLATTQPGRLGHCAMSMLSHAGDNAVESC
jgi:hypothetical protein